MGSGRRLNIINQFIHTKYIKSNFMSTIKNEVNQLLLSIIIATLNREEYIERCLVSIFKEIESNYQNTEVIIIDGGSKDKTVEILKKYDHKIAYWVSEPDSGVSDATNKAIAKAKGDVIRGIGDDDELIPGYLKIMMDFLNQHPEVDILLGQADMYIQKGDSIIYNPTQQPIGSFNFKDLLNLGNKKKGGIGYPSPEVAFQRREVFESCGVYDVNYHYYAYLEHWLRCAKKGFKFLSLPDITTKRYLTENSDTIKGDPQVVQQEFIRVLKKYGGPFWRYKNIPSKPIGLKANFFALWEALDTLLDLDSLKRVSKAYRKLRMK
jgi:glycosyltransferase involved in cell wall biosynthesis